MGSTFSDSHPQEMGVPQGSILSVTFFSVKINSITQCLKPGVDCSLYVDDFQICYRSSTMRIIEHIYTDGSRHGSSLTCATVFTSDIVIQHPFLLLKSGQLLKPWNKLKFHLHPNELFLQIHFRGDS